jgi:hypothetical protein
MLETRLLFHKYHTMLMWQSQPLIELNLVEKKIGKSIYNPPQTITINVPIELPILSMSIHKLSKSVDLPSNNKNILHKIIKISKTKKKNY